MPIPTPSEPARRPAAPTRRPSWRLVLALSVAHFLLALGLLLLSLTLDGGIDAEEPLLPSPLPELCAGVTAVLMQPGAALWSHLQSGEALPDALEWLLVLCNSLLWGGCVALLLRARRARSPS
jgi:hypothetical protein